MAFELDGVVINEILLAPNDGNGGGFDTNNDGQVTRSDEFIELYNTAGTAVDISGWQIYDNAGVQHTFPAGTEIAANGYLVLSSHDADITSGPNSNRYLRNSGDAIALYNPDTNEYIAATAGTFLATPNVPVGATEVGTDSFGASPAGQSLERDPDGSDTITSGTPNPECFLAGTTLLTDNGDVAVETLKIGDRVQAADGSLHPIKWIGYQTVDPSAVENPLRGYPILVKAGALGENLPRRDLYVSPDHALLFDGLLINAGALVNDCSILKTEPTTAFTYYHIELDHHALLVAEGTLAESYLPQKEDRYCYDNGSEYDELYPGDRNVLLWPLDYPRISSYTTVPRYIRKQLMAIAQTLPRTSVLKTA